MGHPGENQLALVEGAQRGLADVPASSMHGADAPQANRHQGKLGLTELVRCLCRQVDCTLNGHWVPSSGGTAGHEQRQ
jgi:hypothetical protein